MRPDWLETAARVWRNLPALRRHLRPTFELPDVRAVDAAGLDGGDRITRELLEQELANAVALERLDLDAWTVDPLEGPHVKALSLVRVQPTRTAREKPI